eukprot:TRINITY_DN17391_c1_g1_i1.p1 TRINITY_DN17391_c1_g1~~TRINITY_DN17391_c1_g1_i1.p1  ORF type:complete len:572 (+),score=132.50 TRINITY_DN17391_c1_g1_i1:42-1757(+)
MYPRDSMNDTLGQSTSLPSMLVGGDEVLTFGGLNPAAPSEPEMAKDSTQLDMLLARAKTSTQGSVVDAQPVMTNAYQPTIQFANMAPASPGRQQQQPQPQQQVQQPPSQPPQQFSQPLYHPPPIHSNVFTQQSSPLPRQAPVSIPVPSPVPLPAPPVIPDQEPRGDSIEEESAMLQAQLAKQTGEMQRYLQTEMAKLSVAMKHTAAGVTPPSHSPPKAYSAPVTPAAPVPVALPVQAPVQQPVSQPVQFFMTQPSHVSSHMRTTSPLRNPNQAPITASPSFTSPASTSHASPAPTWADVKRSAELAEITQKRIASPVWDEPMQALTPMGKVAVPSNLNSVATESAGNPRDSLATTSLPSIRCIDSTVSDRRQQYPLNPPSASDASEAGGDKVREYADRLRSCLANVHEASQAMVAAQNLAALNLERLVDVLQQFAPSLERKEIGITWKSLVGNYVKSAEKFHNDKRKRGSRSSGKGSATGGVGGVQYELDESLPPTPRSNNHSEFTLGTNGMERTLEEVMSFIDKPLSPQSLKRISKVRAKHDAMAATDTIPSHALQAAAYAIPFNAVGPN